MAVRTAKAASTGSREIVLTRLLDAPVKTVWKAWTDPKELAKWWMPVDWTIPVCELDVRPGGVMRIVAKGPGFPRHEMVGSFREVVSRERLVFSSRPLDEQGNALLDSVTTVTFKDKSGKTELRVHAKATPIAPAATQMILGMEAGWSQTLMKLDSVVTGSLDREIVVTRCLNAPRETVWKAWTDPAQIVKWWGPQGFTTTIETMDLRSGGDWKLVMHGPDGKDYPNRSKFVQIVKPSRIVYKHGGGSKGGPGANFTATWSFEAMGAQTILTAKMVFRTSAELAAVVKAYNAVEGAAQTFDRLAAFVEGRKA